MTSIKHKEWYIFVCLCSTLMIFALVVAIQNFCKSDSLFGPPMFDSSAYDVEIVLEERDKFIAIYPQLSVYHNHTNDLIQPVKIASNPSLDDFIKELEIVTNLKNIAEAVEKFLSIVTEFDGVIEIFFKLLPHDSDYDKMLHQFNNVYEKIDALTAKMEEIEKEIDIVIDWRDYKDQRHMVLSVSESFNSMVRYPNDSTFQMKFIESCKANRMEDRLVFLEREMNRAYLDSMIYKLGSEFHMDFFLSSSADVLTTSTKAAFLLGTCLRKEQEKENISDGYINTEKDISRNKVRSIVKSIRDGEAAIKQGYLKYLRGEIKTKLEEAGAMSHDKFAELLFIFINTKYNWRTWFVASYNANAQGYAIFGTTSAILQSHNNRNVMVTTPPDSTKPSDSDFIKQKFSDCIWPHFIPHRTMDDCLNIAKNAIGCVPEPMG